MDKKIIERAVDAAENVLLGRQFAVTSKQQREYLWDAVTAALAEVEGSIKAQTLREYADAGRHPWIVFRRKDGSPVTVNDHMRETAARLEAGGEL